MKRYSPRHHWATGTPNKNFNQCVIWGIDLRHTNKLYSVLIYLKLLKEYDNVPIYYFPNGRASEHPTSYELACELKTKRYDEGIKCPKCNARFTSRYTKNQECAGCAQLKAGDFYNLCKRHTKMFCSNPKGGWMSKVSFGIDRPIEKHVWDEMIDLAEIYHSGDEFTVSEDACKTHGHYGLKRHGKCYQCQLMRTTPSPRQQAVLNGETWYTPATDCPRCGTRALRNVHNGSCQGCNPPSDNRTTATSIMMDNNPDMVISREEARDLEMTVYRTGEKCINGHTGWRYTSTGNCIDCRKKESI